MNRAAKWQRVCAPERTVIPDTDAICRGVPGAAEPSPIDAFYRLRVELVRVLGTVQNPSAAMLRMVLSATISGTEEYFRSLLAGLISHCPHCGGCASSQMLSLGSLQYYSPGKLGRALMEGTSFASVSAIRDKTSKLMGLTPPKPTQNGSLAEALKHYDKICHLRHASLHADGHISHQNAVALGLAVDGTEYRVDLDVATLQDCIGACETLVRAYNRWAWKQLMQEWLTKQLLSADWQRDGRLFSEIYALFYSTEDGDGLKVPYHAYLSFRPAIVASLARRP